MTLQARLKQGLNTFRTGVELKSLKLGAVEGLQFQISLGKCLCKTLSEKLGKCKTQVSEFNLWFYAKKKSCPFIVYYNQLAKSRKLKVKTCYILFQRTHPVK
jgi:hypothetical protein